MKCYCGVEGTLSLLGVKKADVYMIGYPNEFEIYRCGECKSIITKDYIYKKAFYQSVYHDAFQKARHTTTYRKRWSHDLQVAGARIDWLDGVLSKNEDKYVPMQEEWITFDIGTANGAFVALANSPATKWVAWGIDHRRVQQKGNVVKGDFLEHEFRKPLTVLGQTRPVTYDLVTAFDVIEHFEHPFPGIVKVCSISTKYIFIDQPDPTSEMATEDGIDWKHIKPQEHNMLISEDLMTKWCGYSGFDLIRKEEVVKGRMSLLYQKRGE